MQTEQFTPPVSVDGATPRYVIGSGWWSTEEEAASVNPKRKDLGDDFIRSPQFFDLWRESIERFTSPERVIVVDSNAPLKPSADAREGVEWVSLPFNAKHATDHLGRWSGWMRSVLVSASYALATECDYFVYVEQDCLLHGENIVEDCVRASRTGISFGSGEGTPQPIQQSFFAVRRDRLLSFVTNLHRLVPNDRDLSPEWKFVCASCAPLVWAANKGLLRTRRRRERALNYAMDRHFDFLPVGTGRTRPIPFDQAQFYFQHGTRDEVAVYSNLVGYVASA